MEQASGARISTYVIFGEAGSRCCVLNGAAARTCQRGDQVIICASSYVQETALYDIAPTVLTFTPDNHVAQVMRYHVAETARRPFDFSLEVVSDAGSVPIDFPDQPFLRARE